MSTVQETPTAISGSDLLDSLLDAQQDTSAVERFAQRHAQTSEPLLGRHYRDLIPLSQPKEGEQYGFEVDLDVCSGCKACVVACHNLNGLDQLELWRHVGLLQGNQQELPILQHVTTACHHCLDPGCLSGCPVKAYEKDPVTGIVRHLDDQCFGCQYCILMCPYEVPQYSPSRGIVRKCDMCHDRLAEGEAPACVQSCPNQAIRITTVSRKEVLQNCQIQGLVPTAPDSRITYPATSYRSQRRTFDTLAAADQSVLKPQHGHLALVAMLVLTQMSVGAFLVAQFLQLLVPATNLANPLGLPWVSFVGLGVGVAGMNLALLHLGRPQLAYRALLGLRTSWLSREILVFGIYAGLAAAFVGLHVLSGYDEQWTSLRNIVAWATAAAGAGGVFCSAMIYAKTRRPYWRLSHTLPLFLMSGVVTGLALALLVSLIAGPTEESYFPSVAAWLCRLLIYATLVKLMLESSVLTSLNEEEYTPSKKSVLLLVGALRQYFCARVALAVCGGIVLPIVLQNSLRSLSGDSSLGMASLLGAVAILLCVLASELLERYLFFAASASEKMPGVACE